MVKASGAFGSPSSPALFSVASDISVFKELIRHLAIHNNTAQCSSSETHGPESEYFNFPKSGGHVTQTGSVSLGTYTNKEKKSHFFMAL